jgi:hypothetical protein
MDAIAHDSGPSSLDRVISLWPEDPGDDTMEMGLRQRAALFSATGVALAGLFTAIVLQTAYHAVILLWVSLGLPLLFAAETIAHIGRAGVDRMRAWSDSGPPQNGQASRQEVWFTFDELALIYKSLEAVKTLGSLPPQDELLQDTIQVVDQSLNMFVR